MRRLSTLVSDPSPELEWADVLHSLRLAVVRLRMSRLHDLVDEEARQALSCVADTLRTRSKGLVYDFRSPDPRIQMTVDSLTSVCNLYEKGERGFRRVSVADLAMLARYLEQQVKTATAQARGTTVWLDLVAQLVSTSPDPDSKPQLLGR
jgi:hypothetical protein